MRLLKFNRITVITLIIFGVQFVNALEYMMVTPLFPFMAKGLGQTVNQAGYVASSYTLASVLSGLVGFFLLDRFNKKRILLLSLLMIGFLTSMIPWITHFSLLLSVRFITGMFGGLVLGTAMALLLDAIPQDQRSKVIAFVLTAFPLVSIAGLPLMLWLAEVWHWHSAFYLLAVICLFCAIAIIFGIKDDKPVQEVELPLRPQIKMSLRLLIAAALPGISNLGTFMFIPLFVRNRRVVYTSVLK
ncbi:MFS transporter [Ignatzschineria rhizosphaerae]|uniref:MFS transporter n=1 Tax=Ignatzschineria rhizosphaerae TaxID=2923279 RepID=A0ABY3X0Y2_9GAMM|nr:MFS transporter [Ignatzschineria rhizosphaerae]UNM96538.1 MFS transporter [Ignatzschineria rhizosphaerae]